MNRALLLFGLTAFVAACAPPAYDTSAAAPSIRILFPEASDSLVYCSTFMVVVEVENFTLSPENYGGTNYDGEGHWHLYDGNTYLVGTAATWAFVPEAVALADGPHTLTAELEQNDHQAYEPSTTANVDIVVDNEAVDDTSTPGVYEGCNGGGVGQAGF